MEVERFTSAVTDGEIAAINLESARRGAWLRFARNARQPGLAEAIVDLERLAAEFLGDLDALDRLETLAEQFAATDGSFRGALVEAEVASTAHRFAEARDHLERAAAQGAPPDDVSRQVLAIDQACGVGLDAVLAARRRIAAETGRLEDLVPLGAVLADLQSFEEADAVYRRAFDAYDGVSPFPLAWVSFQLGMLWGELALAPDTAVAARWYRRAIACLPGYVKARVHLAEIFIHRGRPRDAEALLTPALTSGDPEVSWRLADALSAQGRREAADALLDAARSRFDELLRRHCLAFADHAAEFYAGSGGNCARALELTRVNATNRPTRRALAQLDTIATLAPERAASPA